MYRFLLTRRWLGLLAVLVLVAAGCVLLGRWQLRRFDVARDLNDLLVRNVAAAPAPAPELLSVGRAPRVEDEWRRVRVVGRYDPSRTLLVRNRPYDGRVGFRVLVPLRTAAGPALLVDRGWVPAGQTAAAVPELPPPPRGEVTVTARVRRSEPAATTAAPPAGQVMRIDVSAIRATLPYPLYGGFGQLVREQPATRPAPALLPVPQQNTGLHLAYALQWWVFAVFALAGYVVMARREAADRRLAPRADQPVVTVRVAG